MGVLYSHLTRQMQRFNVENRAMRSIERKKPVTAPRHPSSKKFYDEIIESSPNVKEKLARKDQQLDKHLRDVYVTSMDMTPEVVRDRSNLPTFRGVEDDQEMGFWEPSSVPEGFCTVRQALQFLSDHATDPKTWTAAAIAEKYKLDEKTVGGILEHVRPFNIYIPEKQHNPGLFGNNLSNIKMLGKVKEEKSEEKSQQKKS